MKSNNLNFKRSLRKYEYLVEELSDVQSIYDEFSKNFRSALTEFGYQSEVSSGSTNTEVSETTEPSLNPKYKKLFRKIVVKTHPDKISKELENSEKEKLLNLYEDAVSANETNDIGKILFVAIQLNIDVSDYSDDIESIVNSCTQIEEKINTLQKSSCWYWNELEDEKEKEEFMKKYISFINK